MSQRPSRRAGRCSRFGWWRGLAIACLALATVPVGARLLTPVSVTLGWNPVGGDVVGYNLYYGTNSGIYTTVVSVDNTNQARITGLLSGIAYFFAITSRDAAGLESLYSAEIVFTPVSSGPLLVGMPLPDGGITLEADGLAGHIYDVLATEDLANWKAIANVAVGVDGSFRFVDPAAAAYPARFYRLNETTFLAPGSLPTVMATRLATGQVQFTINGVPGHSYDILGTSDEVNWRAFASITAAMDGTASITESLHIVGSFVAYQLVDTTFTAAGLPTFQLVVQPLGGVQLQITGLFGHTYQVQRTIDMFNWTVLGQVNVPASGVVAFNDVTSLLGLLPVYRLIDISSGINPP